MTDERASHAGRVTGSRMAAPLALGVLGLALWLLSQDQPARLGDAIGPGYMARGLSLGVMMLAALWGAVSLWRERGAKARVAPPARPAQRAAGVALLAGVLAFALAVPVFGLVAGASLAAGFSAWATGVRDAWALAATMAALAILTSAIGLVLLPPTAPLWPRL